MSIIQSIKEHQLLINLPENDKAVMVNIAVSMLYFFFFLIAFLADFLPPAVQFTNPEAMHLGQKVYLGSVGIMMLLLMFILYMRKKSPESTLANTIQIYFIGHPLVLFSVFNGITQLITGLLLGLLPLIGLILFNNKHVFFSTIILWIEILILACCISLGWLPNAPLYIASVKAEHVPLLFILNEVIIGLPAAVVVMLMGYTLMQGIAKRESTILELSRKDSLTGLWNRRYLNEVLHHEIESAARHYYAISIIMLDLDYFKKINDKFGHHAGDKVLIATTELLHQCVRTTDYVGRFGGEEFLIVLPYCDATQVMEVTERCRLTLASQSISLGQDTLNITGSFGATTLPLGDRRATNTQQILDKMVNTADKALYKAKALGRNRIEFKLMDIPEAF